jgi:hypothetical protein
LIALACDEPSVFYDSCHLQRRLAFFFTPRLGRHRLSPGIHDPASPSRSLEAGDHGLGTAHKAVKDGRVFFRSCQLQRGLCRSGMDIGCSFAISRHQATNTHTCVWWFCCTWWSDEAARRETRWRLEGTPTSKAQRNTSLDMFARASSISAAFCGPHVIENSKWSHGFGAVARSRSRKTSVGNSSASR